MFTGIVQAVGEVAEVRASAQDRDVAVRCPAAVTDRLDVGASVALDGVCQTVTALERGRFEVHAIAETLRVTTLGSLRPGSPLNLETALGAGEPMGGHFVQGHVDGLARIAAVRSAGESIAYSLEAAPELVRQLVPKGSVALDGISLTLGPEVGQERFEVYLIPHTLEVTTLGAKSVGDFVNLETDILGKYVQRYLGASSGLQWADLARAGFAAESDRTRPGGPGAGGEWS
jgi:riboflavin synthase